MSEEKKDLASAEKELTEEKSEDKIEQKKDRKARKTKGEPANRKTMIICLAIALICATIGAFGGMFLYEQTQVSPTYVPRARHNSTPVKDKADSIAEALKNDEVVEKTRDSLGDVLNYACWLHATSPFGIMVGYSKAVSGASTTEVTNAVVSTPTECFYQNVSHSTAVMGITIDTAYRYYDQKNGSLNAYECKTTDEWKKAGDPTKMSYDGYIQKYGKLFKGDYFVTQDKEDNLTVPEKYLTDDLDAYKASPETNKYEINGVIAYDITNSNLLEGSSLTKNADGTYTLKAVLDPNKALSYYRVQMKTTGGLDDYPTFSSSELTFTLDENLYPISSVFRDHYSGHKVVGVDIQMIFYQYYYHADSVNGFKDKDGQDFTVSIPNINDTDDPYTSERIHDFSSEKEEAGKELQ